MRATQYILNALTIYALDNVLETDSQKELLRTITDGYNELLLERPENNVATIQSLQKRVGELESQLAAANTTIQTLRTHDPNAVGIRVADSIGNNPYVTQIRYIAKDKFEQMILELEKGCPIQAIKILRAEVTLAPGTILSLQDAVKTVRKTEPRFAEAYNKGMALRDEHERRSKQFR